MEMRRVIYWHNCEGIVRKVLVWKPNQSIWMRNSNPEIREKVVLSMNLMDGADKGKRGMV